MRISRRLTLPAHGAIEVLMGIALMLFPVALGFAPAGLITAVLLGAILTGAALALNTQPISSSAVFHNEFDSGFIAVTAIAAFVLATAGQGRAALLLAAVVVVQAMLRYATGYVITG
jgi:hypothetical protein